MNLRSIYLIFLVLVLWAFTYAAVANPGIDQSLVSVTSDADQVTSVERRQYEHPVPRPPHYPRPRPPWWYPPHHPYPWPPRPYPWPPRPYPWPRPPYGDHGHHEEGHHRGERGPGV